MSNPLDDALAAVVTPGTSNAVAARKQAASELIGISLQWPVQLANQLNDLMNRFWGSADPQKLADEIDRQRGVGFTATLFQFHGELAAFVAAKTPSLADKLVKRPAEYTVEVIDGRVVITEVESE